MYRVNIALSAENAPKFHHNLLAAAGSILDSSGAFHDAVIYVPLPAEGTKSWTQLQMQLTSFDPLIMLHLRQETQKKSVDLAHRPQSRSVDHQATGACVVALLCALTAFVNSECHIGLQIRAD
jgi:hypothetical protein